MEIGDIIEEQLYVCDIPISVKGILTKPGASPYEDQVYRFDFRHQPVLETNLSKVHDSLMLSSTSKSKLYKKLRRHLRQYYNTKRPFLR